MDTTIGTISVVIPAYNCVASIGAAIDSVLVQTLLPMEIVIVDDCSTDKTTDFLQSLSEKYPQIRLLRNDRNCGVALSRNRGVQEAKGDWIAFLDSDDQWTADKLEKQAKMLAETGGSFGFTGSAFIDETGRLMPGILEVPEAVGRQALLRQNVISCSSVMIRRDVMLRYPMIPGSIHEDFHAWLRILEELPAANGLNEPLLIYRLSAESRSGNKVRSFRMNYRTYRAVGLSPLQSCGKMYWYTINGLRKYHKINK